MRRTLGVGLVLMASLAACSTPRHRRRPRPSRRPCGTAPDQINQAAAIWRRRRPIAYAYTFDHEGRPATTSRIATVPRPGGRRRAPAPLGPALPAEALGTMTVETACRRARTRSRAARSRSPTTPAPREPDGARVDERRGAVRGRRRRRRVDDFTTAATIGARRPPRGRRWTRMLRRSARVRSATALGVHVEPDPGEASAPIPRRLDGAPRPQGHGGRSRSARATDGHQDDVSLDGTVLAVTERARQRRLGGRRAGGRRRGWAC